jgi:hypothetical protein
MLMSSVVINVRLCGWKGGKWGSGGYARRLKMGQLTLTWGQQGWKFASSYKETPFHIRGYFSTFINTTHANNNVYLPAMLYV